MAKVSSPYYPPRARWYGPLLGVGEVFRRRLALDRFRLPPGPSLGGVLGSLLLPGYGFYSRGFRLAGIMAFGASLFLLLLFFVAIGYPLGNMAFGLLLSIHATSVVFVFEPWLAGARFRTRILLTLCLLFAFWGLIYMPARNWLETKWLAPLSVNGTVVVVQKSSQAPRVKRNDWIAYSLPGSSDHTVYVRSGFGLGPVLAVAGDRVRFTATALEVNGVSQPRLDNMPETGELVVPEKHWLVWPDFGIGGHGNVAGAVLTATLLQMATISEDQFVGKPFKRWFWRRQLSS